MIKSVITTSIFFLILLCSKTHISHAQNITWVQNVGLSISGNDITKTNSTGWNNGGVASEEILDYVTDGWVEATIAETNKRRALGLSEINSSSGLSTIDFSIFLSSTGKIYIYENGAEAFHDPTKTYLTGQKIKIERDGVFIRYWLGSNNFYTSQTHSTSRLLVDLAFDDIGGTLNDVTLSDSFTTPAPSNTDQNAATVQQSVNWTDISGVAFINDKIVKTEPSQWNNAGLASVERLDYVTDGWVQTVIYETNTRRSIGLSEINTSAGNSGIDFSLFLNSNGQVIIYENAQEPFNDPAVTYVSGDVMRIERQGLQILYMKNDSIFYTSQIQSISRLIIDLAFDDKGGTLSDISVSSSFGTPVPSNTDPDIASVQQTVNWTDISGLAFISDKLVKTEVSQWGNTGAASFDFLAQNINGWVESKVYETTTARMIGLSESNTNEGFQTIDYALYLKADGTIEVYENGVPLSLPLRTYETNDLVKVQRMGTNIEYIHKGDLIYTSLIPSTSKLVVDLAFNDHNATLGETTVSTSFTNPFSTNGLWNKNGSTVYTLSNVAIGRNALVDDYTLSVQGKILAQGVKVTLAGWADFVFNPNYDLKPISEVEAFIKTNSHLPDIPSESEVLNNGINLGEMDAKLLRKIEELTLYLIQQNKQIELQNKRIKELEEFVKKDK